MIAQFSIVPMGKTESLSQDVAKVLDLVDKSGLDYKLTAMATIIEGDTDQVFDLIKKCHQEMRKSSSRVLTHINIDDREGAKGRIKGKVEDVEKVLGKKLNK